MKRRQYMGLVTGVTTALITGCVGRDLDEVRGTTPAETETESEPDTPTGTPTETEVTIKANTFDPNIIDVPVGSEITWVNESGGEIHIKSYIYSDDATDWELDSKLKDGETISATFDEKGIYQYYSVGHGTFSMCGMVKVGGATTEWHGGCL